MFWFWLLPALSLSQYFSSPRRRSVILILVLLTRHAKKNIERRSHAHTVRCITCLVPVCACEQAERGREQKWTVKLWKNNIFLPLIQRSSQRCVLFRQNFAAVSVCWRLKKLRFSGEGCEKNMHRMVWKVGRFFGWKIDGVVIGNRGKVQCHEFGASFRQVKGTASWLLRSGGTWSGQKESASGAVGGTPGGRKKGTLAGHFLGKQTVCLGGLGWLTALHQRR